MSDLDRELDDLPPDLCWRERMRRIVAVLSASASPVPRADLARVVGQEVSVDLLIEDLAADLESECFGHQPGDGSGDVFFHLDPLWADPETDFIGIDTYMPLSDWRDEFEHVDAAEGWPAIYDRASLHENIAGGECFDWLYASAADRTAQVRIPITDGAAAKPWIFRYKDLGAWWSNAHYNRAGGVESGTPTAWTPQSKPIWFTELGCPAFDCGTNQPNVFFDPKSSESFTPHFSRGCRDDTIQRAYLQATWLWWDAPNNPVSSVYGGRMVHVPECAAWASDARPCPFFPAHMRGAGPEPRDNSEDAALLPISRRPATTTARSPIGCSRPGSNCATRSEPGGRRRPQPRG